MYARYLGSRPEREGAILASGVSFRRSDAQARRFITQIAEPMSVLVLALKLACSDILPTPFCTSQVVYPSWRIHLEQREKHNPFRSGSHPGRHSTRGSSRKISTSVSSVTSGFTKGYIGNGLQMVIRRRPELTQTQENEYALAERNTRTAPVSQGRGP